MTELQIREDDLSGARIRRFLREHLANMHAITPPESVHALDLDGLRAPGISFWSVWSGDELVGCGALREIDSDSGEVKSMRTVHAVRGRGVGSLILEHIIAVATQRQYSHLYLETGAMPEFEPARSLYKQYGFEFRGPFPPYVADSNSVFMEKPLSPADTAD